MTKIQTILSLFLFVVIVFSMDMFFGNPIRETFNNQIGLPSGINNGINGVDLCKSSKLNYNSVIKPKTINGNMIYSGSSFLGDDTSYPKGDDQPLFFGFSSL